MNAIRNHKTGSSFVARTLSAVALTGFAGVALASAPATSMPSDGWQILSAAAPASASATTVADVASAPVSVSDPKRFAGPASASVGAVPTATSTASVTDAADVASVVLSGGSSVPGGTLTFTVTPRDLNLRNALDRWLQQVGWQLAWSVNDDLPIEFNATFTGNFTSVLEQVMRATNHMHTPTRVCRYTNNVIRVIARAANCQD